MSSKVDTTTYCVYGAGIIYAIIIGSHTMKTPISDKLAAEFDKINNQYKEGAITANELICAILNRVNENYEGIVQEYELEHSLIVSQGK